MDVQRVFITGVSSGIGHALAHEYLRRRWQVFGVSRRAPDDLTELPNFTFESLDLTQPTRVADVLGKLLRRVDTLNLVVLNAGTIGLFDDLPNVSLDDLKHVMDVNVWANKTVLDQLFASTTGVDQVIAISSGASVNGNRGWAGYSISKAALNMLVKLSSREHPTTHFCSFAPGVIDTPLLDKICSLPSDERFPALDNLRTKRNTPAVCAPSDAAATLVDAFARLPSIVESGDYADIRDLPE
jgi:NAD(P)-dependent dehydrogenase (short-subunit alcohol dehydrogenase family)